MDMYTIIGQTESNNGRYFDILNRFGIRFQQV